jgi:type VI secretion system protein ImpC
MAVNINRSFKLYGWCSRIRGIESGGAVEGLPTHSFPTDDGGVDMKCPTEIGISDRREAELAKAGLMPLIHRKNTDMAAFIGAQSLHKPAEYDDPDATANANLAARLPYLFATCRFAHYLKCMVRNKIGSFKSRDDMQVWLKKWIDQYVDYTPNLSSEETKARKPLAAADVVIEEVEGNPGYYSSKFFLRPHYQLEGLTVSLRLVSRLPSEKQ